MKIDTEIWLTQKEMAEVEGVSIQAVHNWVNRGKIQTLVLPGNTTLVNRHTLNIKTHIGRPRKLKKC